ncbi:hypothetical protein [Nonomuraea sp. NPDC049504]|uniref:hypothetical protein n=1 Tax=Nonomuraea sp. NPDC049504 TaxID=3154729 RepID=UPI0034247933
MQANRYTYANASPLTGVDPTGHSSEAILPGDSLREAGSGCGGCISSARLHPVGHVNVGPVQRPVGRRIRCSSGPRKESYETELRKKWEGVLRYRKEIVHYVTKWAVGKHFLAAAIIYEFQAWEAQPMALRGKLVPAGVALKMFGEFSTPPPPSRPRRSI